MVRIYGNVMLSPPQDVNLKQDEANVAGRKKIVFVDASSSTTVPAGASETITIQPPQGKIWRVMLFEFYVNPPKNASTGQHRLMLYLAYSYNSFFRVYNSYGGYIYVVGNHVLTSHNVEDPDSDVAQILLLSQLKISHGHYLKIAYDNSTDADQTDVRRVRVYLEEEDEAP